MKPLSSSVWNSELRILSMALLLVWASNPVISSACATCFGRSDSPLAQGMNMGILTLLIVIGSVLAAISSFFIFLSVRASKMEAAYEGNDGLNESLKS